MWEPNAAQMHVASALEGPYILYGNPCRGEPFDQHATTFRSQPSFAVPLNAPDDPGHFLIMADRWLQEDLGNSTWVLQMEDHPELSYASET